MFFRKRKLAVKAEPDIFREQWKILHIIVVTLFCIIFGALGYFCQLYPLYALSQFFGLFLFVSLPLLIKLKSYQELREQKEDNNLSGDDAQIMEEETSKNTIVEKIKSILLIKKIKQWKRLVLSRLGQAYYIIIGFVVVIIGVKMLMQPTSTSVFGMKTNFVIGIGCLVASSIVRAISHYYLSRSLNVLSEFYKLGYWLVIVCGTSIILTSFGVTVVEPWLTKGMLLISIILSIEVLIRGIIGIFHHKQYGVQAFLCENFLVLHFLVYGDNPLDSFFNFLEDLYGVNIKNSRELSLIKRSVFPLICLILIGTWLSSSLVMIDVKEVGVVEHFGKIASTRPLEPGLHVVFPWPVDKVEKVTASRIKSIPIGLEEDARTSSLLWTKEHAQKEYNLLLGDGRDLVSFNGYLEYRIGNVYDYLYQSQNPEEVLEEIAYRVLMIETVDKSLDGVLSESVQILGRRLTEEIKKEVEKQGIGIEVVALRFQNIHPPKQLAQDYQAVVSAQSYKETRIIDAHTYQIQQLAKANSVSLGLENDALSEKAIILAKAKGETKRFLALTSIYLKYPTLFQFRKRIEQLEKALQDKKIFIIDDRIRTENGNMWIDFRSNNNGV